MQVYLEREIVSEMHLAPPRIEYACEEREEE